MLSGVVPRADDTVGMFNGWSLFFFSNSFTSNSSFSWVGKAGFGWWKLNAVRGVLIERWLISCSFTV